MNITLEQVDQVRERCDVSYQKAKEALEHTEGDVLEAIVYLENGDSENKVKEFHDDVIKALKEFVKSGNVNRIVVEQSDGKVLMNIPVTVGVIGAVLLSSAVLVGIIAALATGCVIKVHKESGEVVNVNDAVKNMYKTTKEKVSKKTSDEKEEVVIVEEEDDEVIEVVEEIFED